MIARNASRLAIAGLIGSLALAAVSGRERLGRVDAAAAAEASAPLANPGPPSFADVVERVRPAVVSVKVKVSDGARSDEAFPGGPDFSPDGRFYRFFRRFGLPDPGDGGLRPRSPVQAQGSGFLISPDGYIVTNNHVVDRVTDVTVVTADGKSLPATVIGVDSKTDLALLKVEGSDFPYETFASQPPRVGDWVIAVGNPFGLGGTVTAGIVSARGRDIGAGPYDDFLQIDAPVNHGNSGGATFNVQGQVVGVNTAIFSPSGGSVGIGFAISSDVVKSVVMQLKDTGAVTRGWIGVQIQSLTQEIADNLGLKSVAGALVAQAEKDSPAERAGVKSGDVITAVDGERVADPHELARRIAALGPKKTATLAIIRNGAPMTLQVTLDAMPAERTALSDRNGRGEGGSGGSALAKLGLALRANGDEGVVVTDVDPDSAAADKGLKEGDVILEVAGKAVGRPSEVASAIDAARGEGKKSVLIRVKNGRGEHFLALPIQRS